MLMVATFPSVVAASNKNYMTCMAKVVLHGVAKSCHARLFDFSAAFADSACDIELASK